MTTSGLYTSEEYFRYSSISKYDLYFKSSCEIINCLNELKDKVPKYLKVVDERYDCLYHKCKWDVVEFFQNPKKFARHPGHTLVEDNNNAEFWVKEYEENKEKEKNLRYTLENNRKIFNYKKCALKIKEEVQEYLNKINHLLVEAERALPWYYFENGWDKQITEPILSKNEEYINEDSIKKDEIMLLIQQYQTALSLDRCLSIIQNKACILQKANEEQYEREKERDEWFRTHPDWFTSIVVGVVTKQFNDPDLGKVEWLYR